MAINFDPELTKTLIDGAREEARESCVETGVSVAGFAAALRGRDQILANVAGGLHARKGPDGRDIACRKGCSHCCHQMVMTSPLEVLHIARHIRAHWKTDDIDALCERLRRLAKVPATEEDRTSRNLPCPLLNEGSCSIYEQRPGACRALFSYSEADCSNGLDASTRTRGGSGLVPSPDLPYIYSAALDIGIDAAVLDQKLDTERIDLVQGLLIALEQVRAESDWLAGKTIFASARITTPMPNRDLVKAALAHLELDPV